MAVQSGVSWAVQGVVVFKQRASRKPKVSPSFPFYLFLKNLRFTQQVYSFF